MSNLINDRGSLSASNLNDYWDNVRYTVSTLVNYDYNSIIENLTLEEDDPEASEVIEYEDIIYAFITKLLRTQRLNLKYAEEEDLSIVDNINNYGLGSIIKQDQNWVNDNVSVQIAENATIIDNINNWWDTDWTNYQNNGGYMTYPNYIDNSEYTSGNNLLTMQTLFSSTNLSSALFNDSARLLIGNEDANFIDINLNNNSDNQYLSNQRRTDKRKPITNFSIQRDKKILENTYLEVSTGERVPVSMLPKTTLQKAIDLTLEKKKEKELNNKTIINTHGSIILDNTNGTVVSYERIITNTTGQGWFDNGYLGTETFEDFGYDSWNVGTSKTLTIIDFGKDKDLPDAYGNSFDDWFINEPYELTQEDDWNNYDEGVTPTIPSCGGGDSSFGTITEDISSQCNGIRTTFTISNSYESGTLKVYWLGQRQSDQTITELTSTTFRTSFVPQSNHVLLVDYTPI